MGSKQPSAMDASDPAVQQQQRGHHLGSYLDLPAVLGSFLMLLLAWAQFSGQAAHPWRGGTAVLFWVLWGVHLLEYVVKIAISQNRLAYVRGHWLALLTALLPFLGFLRAFKGVGGRLFDAAHLAILKQRQLGKLALITVQVVFIAAVIELVLEQHAKGSNITTWLDALYWSATTVTTVASQFAPVTTGGEVVSFLLMLYAVLVFTYFMSSLASALIGGDQQTQAAAQHGAEGQQGPASPTQARAIRLTDQEIEALRSILHQVERAKLGANRTD